jgi:hypothetical protein
MRKILGRYVIGEVIVPFLIIFEKDGRMTPAEIEEWLDSLEM